MSEPGLRPRTGNGAPPEGARVRGWKDIGRWFGVDERTVTRWETARALPIRRVPGEPRAPVFAYEAELTAWLESRGNADAEPAPMPPAEYPRRTRLLVALALGVVVLAMLGWRVADDRQRAAQDRIADVRQLARAQVKALSDRLEQQPGTVPMRAALARDAAGVLARIAALPDASPSLRREAAEAYRLLARVQSSTDRPSLHDRAAARATLDTALALIAADQSVEAGQVRAMILIDAARHAAADGAPTKAPAMLAQAAAAADAPAALREDLRLAESEIAQWQGDYATAIARARAVQHATPADPAGWLRQVRARDLAAEARYYAGDVAGAVADYRVALAQAQAGQARFSDQVAFAWAVLRQQWNLGSSLLAGGQATTALPVLEAAMTGWKALARADPQDESLARWVRVTRLSYGEALLGTGRTAAAIAELSTGLAETRVALEQHPGGAERQRSLVLNLTALANALAIGQRQAEACALLSEAAALERRMAVAGAVTGLDRSSMRRDLQQAAARHCPKTLAVAA